MKREPIYIGSGWGRAPVECPKCAHEKRVSWGNVIYVCSKCGTHYLVIFDGRYYPNGTPWAEVKEV